MGEWSRPPHRRLRPPPPASLVRPVAAHSTLKILFENDYLQMGRNTKIRPIFVLYEWCSVILVI